MAIGAVIEDINPIAIYYFLPQDLRIPKPSMAMGTPIQIVI